jgi:hypothetical protein
MQNHPKKNPEIEPTPYIPVVPSPPEITPNPEKIVPLPFIPGIEPIQNPEIEPIK